MLKEESYDILFEIEFLVDELPESYWQDIQIPDYLKQSLYCEQYEDGYYSAVPGRGMKKFHRILRQTPNQRKLKKNKKFYDPIKRGFKVRRKLKNVN